MDLTNKGFDMLTSASCFERLAPNILALQDAPVMRLNEVFDYHTYLA